MRRCIICLLILFSSLSFSQDEMNASDKIDFGFRFGLSLSDLTTSSNTLEPRPTFMLGVHAEYKFTPSWSIQPELIYARKGRFSRSPRLDSGPRTENRLLLDYVELPVLAKYYFNQGLSLEVGPYLSYLIKAEQENLENTTIQSSSVFQQVENVDAGLAIGATYITDWNFFVGMRITHGFINVFNDSLVIFEDSYHAQFQMYLGYSF